MCCGSAATSVPEATSSSCLYGHPEILLACFILCNFSHQEWRRLSGILDRVKEMEISGRITSCDCSSNFCTFYEEVCENDDPFRLHMCECTHRVKKSVSLGFPGCFCSAR